MSDLVDQLKLCLVAGPDDCQRYPLLKTIRLAIQGGVTCYQLRWKEVDEKSLFELAQNIQSQLPKGVLFIINDSVAVAQKVGDGVHLGQSDVNALVAREILGEKAVIGLSISSLDEAHHCRDYPVNYFGIGPVFATATKLDAGNPVAVSELEEIIALLSPKPCVLIGGLNKKTLTELPINLLQHIAVVSAITHSDNPSDSAEELIEKLL